MEKQSERCPQCGGTNLKLTDPHPSAYMSALSEDDPERYDRQRFCVDCKTWVEPGHDEKLVEALEQKEYVTAVQSNQTMCSGTLRYLDMQSAPAPASEAEIERKQSTITDVLNWWKRSNRRWPASEVELADAILAFYSEARALLGE